MKSYHKPHPIGEKVFAYTDKKEDIENKEKMGMTD
jgi:hypothetical protein